MAAIQPLPVEVAGIFTIVGVPILIAVWFTSGKDSGKGWSGGKNDPIRRMLYTQDGSHHPEMKPLITLWFAVWLLVIWILASLNFV